jgi:hypothetical protein
LRQPVRMRHPSAARTLNRVISDRHLRFIQGHPSQDIFPLQGQPRAALAWSR